MSDTGDEKFNPHEWVPPIMAIGTWLFVIHEAYNGRHWAPDEWILGIILSPYGGRVYSMVRDRLGGAIKRLPKKN
jgi:hypothetical protein